jgi:hypothetical protein
MGIFSDLYDTYLNDKQRRERDAVQQRAIANIPNDMAGVGYKPTEETTPVAPQAPVQQAPQVQAPQAPVAPANDFLKYTAQNESGNNPNIGYHNPQKGTAYGTYGITAPAYKDVQAANPQFQGRDITSLTPEEQGQAALAYKGVLAKQLQAQGIQPTEQNLRAAYYAGANGLKRFQQNGYVSPEAAAANGGAQNVANTINARLAGNAAPASGAAEQPVVPGAPVNNAPATVQQVDPLQDFHNALNSGDKDKIAAYASRNDIQPWQKQEAYKQLAGVATTQQQSEKGQIAVQSAVQSQDPKAIDKALRDKDYGKYAMAWLASGLGFTSLAKDLMAEAGSDQFASFQATTLNDQPVSVKFNATSGRAIDGYNTQTGQQLTPTELAQLNGQGGGAATKPNVAGGGYEKLDPATGKVAMKGRLVTEERNGRTNTYIESGGKKYPYDASWRQESISTSAAKAENQAQTTLKYATITEAAKAKGKVLGEMAEFGVDVVGYNGDQPIIVDKATNQVLRPDANGNVNISAPNGQTLSQMKTGAALNKVSGEDVIKYKTEISTAKTAANDVSNLIGRQRELLKDPEAEGIFGIANAAAKSGDTQKARILTDILTGKFVHAGSEEEFQGRIANLGLTPRQQQILFQYQANQSQINSKTLRQNEGPGSISDAEQRANRQANIDIARMPALPAVDGLHMREFDANVIRYKGDFIANQTAQHPNWGRLELENAWGNEEQKINNMYMDAYRDRLKVLGPNPTYKTIQQAYEQIPVPQYVPGQGFKPSVSSQGNNQNPAPSGIRIIKREKI